MRSQSMEPPIAMSLDRYTLDVLRVGKKLRTVALLCCYMDCKPCRQLDVPTHTLWAHVPRTVVHATYGSLCACSFAG